MRIVQLRRGEERRVAIVDEPRLRLVDPEAGTSVYALALAAVQSGKKLTSVVEDGAAKETLDYDRVYEGSSQWHLLPSFDHPDDVARCMVSGTGLTHKASAENRAAMHKRSAAEITDSIRMYQMGLEGGNPPAGEIGLQPEWFFKGNGSTLRGHGDVLTVPRYAWDGGEEPEIAGVYVVSPGSEPCRVGLTVANEFSDHQMEKKNYLYLAPSKLRNCSIGPELTIGGEPFEDVPGTVSIFRGQEPIWRKDIWSGQKNMSYSLANLEHHHFKYEAHRRPGDVHIHFFGADAFSFGNGVALEDGDIMQVSFPQFGRPLRNAIRIHKGPESLIAVKAL
ncbi:MAG: GguC protein [Acidobacteriaceae bacterium]|nr:GguC protein [Acidobacteriaceae bacterium]